MITFKNLYDKTKSSLRRNILHDFIYVLVLLIIYLKTVFYAFRIKIKVEQTYVLYNFKYFFNKNSTYKV